ERADTCLARAAQCPPSAKAPSSSDARSANGSREGAQNMDIKRNGSQPSGKGPAEYFTGTVRIDPLFQAHEPVRAVGASVTFEPGARTAWHAHPLGQSLIVIAGCGRAQRWGGPLEEIRPGDVVSFAPAEAAREADTLLVAVHWSRIGDVLKQAGTLSGKVIVTCSLPMNASDTALVVAHTSSGAEALARKVPRAKVAAAFGTVPSEVLFG